MNQNGMNLLAEFDAYGNTIAEYTHGHTEIDGIGSMVAAKKTDYGAPMFPVTYYQYPIYNGPTGDVMALVDENGNVVGDYEYDPWGNRLHAAETGAQNRFGYRSNWITLPDSNGEIIISRTRPYYAPTGRFLQRDFRRSWSPARYRYARVNPMAWVDPDGRNPMEILADGPIGQSDTEIQFEEQLPVAIDTTIVPPRGVPGPVAGPSVPPERAEEDDSDLHPIDDSDLHPIHDPGVPYDPPSPLTEGDDKNKDVHHSAVLEELQQLREELEASVIGMGLTRRIETRRRWVEKWTDLPMKVQEASVKYKCRKVVGGHLCEEEKTLRCSGYCASKYEALVEETREILPDETLSGNPVQIAKWEERRVLDIKWPRAGYERKVTQFRCDSPKCEEGAAVTGYPAIKCEREIVRACRDVESGLEGEAYPYDTSPTFPRRDWLLISLRQRLTILEQEIRQQMEWRLELEALRRDIEKFSSGDYPVEPYFPPEVWLR